MKYINYTIAILGGVIIGFGSAYFYSPILQSSPINGFIKKEPKTVTRIETEIITKEVFVTDPRARKEIVELKKEISRLNNELINYNAGN